MDVQGTMNEPRPFRVREDAQPALSVDANALPTLKITAQVDLENVDVGVLMELKVRAVIAPHLADKDVGDGSAFCVALEEGKELPSTFQASKLLELPAG